MRFRVQKGMRRFDGVGMYFKVYTPLDVPVTRRVACVCSPISDANSFDKLCRELAKQGCLCVTVELPGFGHTFRAVDEGFGTGRGLRVSVLFRWLPFHAVDCVL